MAFRDSWHSALVYFGLAEEYPDDYDEDVQPETEIEDRYRERPNVRRLRRRRDEYDDIFAEDEATEAQAGRPGRGRSATVLKSVGSRGNGDVRVHLVVPKSFNDAQQIADKFKDSIPVILNLQSSDTDLSKRLIDFASGLTYALDGGMQRIADKVFMLTPRNVEISAEERARLIEKGFFNQRALTPRQPERPMQVGLIGCGNMARALARGWGRPLLCADPLAERAKALAAEVGGEALDSNAEVAGRADLVLLCHKPAQLREVAGEVAPDAKAVASILAATPLTALREAYPGRPVYRFIPSLPVEVRQGATVQARGPAQDPELDERVAACSRSSARWWCSTMGSWTWRWG